MSIQYTFRRREKKYLLSPQQFAAVREALHPYMEDDAFGLHTILNIYFDTPDGAMIRHSLTHPPYKEKFRLRAYGQEDGVYAEIKKKYKGVVYKRRVLASPEGITRLLAGETLPEADGQIQREIHWLLRTWQPTPKVFIGYDRIACTGREDPQLRITFDQHLRWRTDRLTLDAGDDGAPVLPQETIVMEIKFLHSMPLWLAQLLSRMQLYPTSFSKYGACWQLHLASRHTEGR